MTQNDLHQPPEVSNRRQRDRLGFRFATDADLAELNEQKKAVLRFLHNEWRSTSSIIAYTGATEVMRRVRELRQDGYKIMKTKGGGTRETARLWFYRWDGRRSVPIDL